MIKKIEELPNHVFGVRVTGEVTEVDLKEVLLPGLEALVENHGEIHYLLLLDTDVKNFTAGAWVQDMIAGIKHFSKWKKIAVVTDQPGVRKFTDMFSTVVPGEAKGFGQNQLGEAIEWVSLKSGESSASTSKVTFKNVAIALAGLFVIRGIWKKIG